MTGTITNLGVHPVHISPFYANHMCPKCLSTDITGGFVEIGEGCAIQEVSCGACRGQWKNVYDFAAVYLVGEGIVIEVGPDGVALVPETESEPEAEQVTSGLSRGR